MRGPLGRLANSCLATTCRPCVWLSCTRRCVVRVEEGPSGPTRRPPGTRGTRCLVRVLSHLHPHTSSAECLTMPERIMRAALRQHGHAARWGVDGSGPASTTCRVAVALEALQRCNVACCGRSTRRTNKAQRSSNRPRAQRREPRRTSPPGFESCCRPVLGGEDRVGDQSFSGPLPLSTFGAGRTSMISLQSHSSAASR